MKPLPNLRLAMVVLAAGFALSCWPAASSAGSQVAWVTPQAMAAKIHGSVPQIQTTNTGAPSTITATACRGTGAARNGRFTTFRCKAHWDRGTATVSARALPRGTFCASSTGIAACPAGPPAAGDPRICHDPPAPPTGDPNRCALGATETAVQRAMQSNFADPSWELGNVSCHGANTAWKCTFMKLNVYGIYYTSKIRFAEVKGSWTAKIVTTGGNGRSTCTALPKKTRPGKPSNWSAGPAPTCA